MKLLITAASLFLVALALSCAGAKPEPTPAPTPVYALLTLPTPVIKEFVDVYQEKKGTVILDIAHRNDFQFWEINVPASRVLSRGYAFDYLRRAGDLEAKLRFAQALVVILPRTGYSKEDIGQVKEFVGKGGRLLLIGDPTRPSEVNSLAADFGLIFEEGYLYNLVENNLNFRDIFVSSFEDTAITRGLERIALYTAGSITSPGKGIAFGDGNTLASKVVMPGKLSPLALTADSRVLALADFTFMIPPFNAVLDNNRLISNIADWLTEPGRAFLISDFPYFLEEPLKIGYASPELLGKSLGLKNFLASLDLSADMGEYPKATPEPGATPLAQDIIFLGLLKHASHVDSLLEAADISITTPPEEEEGKEKKTTKIEIGSFGDVYKEGTGLFYLYEAEGKHALLLMADTEDILEQVIGLFQSGQFRDWLISDRIGLYYKSVQAERLKP